MLEAVVEWRGFTLVFDRTAPVISVADAQKQQRK
jgi:hypothetical protein